jgi:hypothetical protein
MQISLERAEDEKGLSHRPPGSQSAADHKQCRKTGATHSVDNDGRENRGGDRGPVLRIFFAACVGWVVGLRGGSSDMLVWIHMELRG